MAEVAHASGPWKLHEQGDANQYYVLGADGRWVLGLIHNGEMLVENQRATLARMVACVNYCADVPAERLAEDSLAIKLEHIERLTTALRDLKRRVENEVPYGVQWDEVLHADRVLP